jgi:predicted HAD superfamily Cof-like phosphohydrolase
MNNDKIKQMMNEPQALNMVGEFHTTFNHPFLTAPVVPGPARQELRVSLIGEELKELKEAFDKGSKLEIIDALCDLQYVLSGTILECGMGDIFAEAFKEVHRSNMSKACVSEEEAIETVEHYADNGKDTCEAYYKEIDGLFLVYRKSDNKTLKSVNYSKASLGRFVLPTRKREEA